MDGPVRTPGAITPRQRAWLIGAAVVGVVALVIVLVVILQGDDEDVTAGGSTIPAPGTTILEVTVPTAQPAETTAATLPVETTVATTPPPTAPPTEPGTTTTAPPAPPAVLATIDGAGDAVLVSTADGARTVLYDGTDPDDPPPAEGETVLVDGVAVTPDLGTAFVGLCCEPVAGSLLVANPPAPVPPDASATVFGHAPAVSRDGTRLVRIVYDTIVVSNVALAEQATLPVDVGTEFALDVAWAGDDRIAVLFLTDAGTTLALADVPASGEMTVRAEATVADHTLTTEGPAPSLAGTNQGAVLVLDGEAATLASYDGASGARDPGRDVALPATARSAWMVDGALRLVTTDRRLLTGDGTVVPGEYLWVR
jgi:hypothetical protein